MPRLRLLLLVTSLLALAACGRSEPDPSPVAPTGQLPALGSLQGNGLLRSTSATEFELMDSTPVAVSSSGVDTSGDQLSLSPPSDGMSWAVYALQGFPTDGSIVPLSVTIDRSLPCWLAFGDFGANRWELVFCDANGTSVPTATSLLSPDGTFYVAVIGFPSLFNLGGSTSVSSLKVNVSADIALPVPALHIISATGQLAAGIPSHFSAEGSEPGTGAAITSITYDWHDGSPTEQVTDPLTEVNHTWPAAGNQTVTVTLENDRGDVVSKDFTVALINPVREMLVVYNTNIPESGELMDYYCGSRYGRCIDPAYKLGLQLADRLSYTPYVPRGYSAGVVTYNEHIRDPIKAFLNDPVNAEIKANTKYLLLIKGVPHQITGPGEFTTDAELASVDSELCCIYSDTDGAPGGYPLTGWLINSPNSFDFIPAANAFYQAGNTNFVRGQFEVCFDPTWDQPDQPSGDEVAFPLDYLVARIDAYTFDEAKLIVDRAINADTSGTGWVVFDSTTGTYGQETDTMVDPVWPWTDNSRKSGQELLQEAGFNVFADVTTERIINSSLSVPPGVLIDGVIGYAGWGVNHNGGSWPHGSDYILEDLGWIYRPGACFSSYESFNGRNFNGSNLGDRGGQGQICDFLRKGGTCAVGNAWEPFTIGCADERWVFDRYINHGDRWIEAAYKGLRLISWMEVVVGDPLCQVK